ncbi:MAG: hypothetical protein KGL43_07395 [Burkholderiales bacterium]|nr:hypothetical protein [Burkholderiales bacterium]MDE2397672.1 hypothetical protein [Burkholderiales bacterium]MDE2453402.1 hypothetical protein [Burkholderiales bacterium]
METIMYHPVLLPSEVLRELPALADDLHLRESEEVYSTWRSEGFAEDLPGAAAHEPPPRRLRRLHAGLLAAAAPVGLALVGALVLFLGHGA